jgi:hypothetical protein
MKTFNITAQAYHLFDKYKQTLLLNEVVYATSEDDARNYFTELLEISYKILKIYSVEEISQVAG